MTKYETEQLAIAEKNIRAIIRRSTLRPEEKDDMLKQVKRYMHFLMGVQSNEHHIRLVYYEAAFEVYNYLRKTHQLERKVVGMRRDIVTGMHEVLQKLSVETLKD